MPISRAQGLGLEDNNDVPLDKRQNADNQFYLSGFLEKEHDFVPMTAQEVTAANARHQDDLYRQMEAELPQQLAYFSESDADCSMTEECEIGHLPSNSQEQSNIDNTKYVRTDLRSSEELELLLEVRAREIRHLSDTKETLKVKLEKEIEDLRKELREQTSAKQRANISLVETQQLLFAQRTESEKLNVEIIELKKQNEKLANDLEYAQLSCNDLEKNMILLEKGSKDKVELLQLEKRFEEREEKHRKEKKQIEEELMESAKKCKSLEIENLELVKKIRELTRSNDDIIVEKTEMVNRMAKEMESLKEELAGGSVTQLQMEVARRQAREAELEAQLRELQRRFDDQSDELRLLWAAPADRGNSNRDLTSSLLHSELLRVCAESKSQRSEITKLQAILHEKEALGMTQNNELSITRRLLADKEKQIERLESQLNEELSRRADELNVSLSDDQKVTEINEENEKLKKQVEVLQQHLAKLSSESTGQLNVENLDRYNQAYLKFHEEKMDALRQELKEHFEAEIRCREAIIENLRSDMEDVKNEYLKIRNNSDTYVEQLKSKDNEIQCLKREIETSKTADSPSDSVVQQLQKELEASRTRVLELSKMVADHCKKDTAELEVEVKNATEERDRLLKEIKVFETDNNGLQNKFSESQETIAILEAKLALLEKERNTLVKDYDLKSHTLQKEMQFKILEVEEKLKSMEQQVQPQKVVASIATSPINKSPKERTFSETEIRERLEKLAEVHEKELRELERQYSLALTTALYQFKPSASATEGRRKIDAATNTESSFKEANEVLVRHDECKAAIEAVLAECDDLRRQLLEVEVHSSTEMRRISEKYENQKLKARRYKEHVMNALQQLHSEHEREKERYDRTIQSFERELADLKKLRPDTLSNAHLETVAKLYDEKIDCVKKHLQNFESKTSKR